MVLDSFRNPCFTALMRAGTLNEDKVVALYADFGINDDALLDVLSGQALAGGHLPFELPSSREAVAAQKSDVPHDSAQPSVPVRVRPEIEGVLRCSLLDDLDSPGRESHRRVARSGPPGP
jgi:hypothetical protein